MKRNLKTPFVKGNTTASRGKGISRNRGETNGQWKGDKVGLGALHAWVERHKPKPNSCQRCNVQISRLDLANISGEYKRDISDFEWLCRRCHMTTDGRLDRFAERARARKFRTPEDIREYQRQWRESHVEYRRDYQKKYQKANREYLNARWLERYYRKKALIEAHESRNPLT